MGLRLLTLILGFALVSAWSAAPGMAATKAGIATSVSVTPLAVASPVVAKNADLPGPTPATVGGSLCDNALRIALVMLALFGLWGLKRIMA